MDAQKRAQALQILSEVYAGAAPALKYTTAYELLVAVILSAQCTDERVNKVTAELFKEHNTPQTMLTLSQEQLEKYIFSCGLYKSKAAHILSASRDIVDKFGGNPAAMKQAGIAYATEQIIDLIANGVRGIHVYTMNKPDVAASIAANLSHILGREASGV